MVGKISEWVLRLIVGGVFLYAGIVKVLDPQQFAIDVQNYQLTNWTTSVIVAVYLPWLEIFAGLGLIIRKLYAGAVVAILTMTVAFLIAICSAWARGLDITCGCFGKTDEPVSYASLLIRDLLLMASTMSLAWMESRRHALGARRGPVSQATAPDAAG